MATIKKPFTVKGQRVTSPRGKALWCKIDKPDRTFNAKGTYSVDLVLDPDESTTQDFIEKLEALRDTALQQANTKTKGKKYSARPVYKEEYDRDGEETGMLVFKFKLNNVDDKKPGQNKVKLVGPKASKGEIPMVDIGNGSTIRCVAFANPYAMASDKTVGISLILEKVQLIELVTFGGDDDLEDEDSDLDLVQDKHKDDDLDDEDCVIVEEDDDDF